jgi:tetratricopeptide (TPR) repeat protein
VLVAAGALEAACTSAEVAKREYFDKGNEFFEAGQYQKAIVEYRNAIGQDERFGEARFKLAEAYAQAGDATRAYREHIRAADLLPNDATAQLRAAMFLLLAREFEDARSRIDRVLAADPGNVDAHILLGNVLSGLGDMEGAVRKVEEAVNLDPGRGLSYVSLAAFHAERGASEEAKQAFERAVALQPDSTTAWLALAHFQMSFGAYLDAEESLKRLLALDPAHIVGRRALIAVYITTQRHVEAESHFKELVTRTSGPEPRLALADYYAGFGRHEDARAVLRPLAAGDAASAAEVRLAQLEYAEKRPARAHQMLDTILRREARNLDAVLMKARWLASEGKPAEALAHAKNATQIEPRSAAAHYLMGTIQIATRDVDGAFKSFTEVVALNPSAAAAQVQLSRLNLARGDANTAVERASAALQVSPDDVNAKIALARGLIARKELREAEREIRALLASHGQAAQVHALDGSLNVAMNNIPRARTAYEHALRLDPGSSEALSGLVSLELAARRPSQARALVAKQLAAHPNRPDIVIQLARVAAAEQDWKEAERLLKQAIAADPGNTAAYGMLGQVYFNQNDRDAAVAELDKIVARNPRDVAAATMAAIIVESQKKVAEAKERYTAILARDPRAALAANNLAWLYAQEGSKLDEALQLAQTAVSVRPDDPALLDTLGWVYYKKGLYPQAVTALSDAVAKAPASAAFRYHLGLAHAKAGEWGRAREALQAALQSAPASEYAAEARRVLAQLGSAEY